MSHIKIGASRQLPIERRCPACDRVLDGATEVGGETADLPEPGCVTICAYCATPLMFTEVSFRILERAEVARLMATNFAFRSALLAVRKLQEMSEWND